MRNVCASLLSDSGSVVIWLIVHHPFDSHSLCYGFMARAHKWHWSWLRPGALVQFSLPGVRYAWSKTQGACVPFQWDLAIF